MGATIRHVSVRTPLHNGNSKCDSIEDAIIFLNLPVKERTVFLLNSGLKPTSVSRRLTHGC